MLATGSRLADGSVLANVSFLNIGPNRTTETDLPMRDNSEAVRVIGSFNSESKFIDARTGRETSVLLTAGRGYFVVGLVGVGQEPTDHADEGHRRQGRRTGAMGPFDHPALPR